jgi:hypothetical protein
MSHIWLGSGPEPRNISGFITYRGWASKGISDGHKTIIVSKGELY